MTLAIMQPYFMPYLGYFQLINAVDEFVVYDNIEYTKKGWINRNRILLNGRDHLFTIPLKNDSDYLDIRERFLSENAQGEIAKILNKIKASYSKAPYFKDIYPFIENIFLYPERNLFSYILNSIMEVSKYLGIENKIYVSSEIKINHLLKGYHKVVGICKERKADIYINPIGGLELYNKDFFAENGISLFFHKMKRIEYEQNHAGFEESLSIIDVLMFNSREKIKELLKEFTLS
jgi:hypothetical protein